MYRNNPDRNGDFRRPLLHVLIAALLVVVCVVSWNKFIRDEVIPRNFGVVESGQVYRSGRLSPRMLKKVIREYNIRTVIDLGGSEPGSSAQKAEEDVCRETGTERYEIRLSGDGTGDPARYAEVLRIMSREEDGPFLVHCAAGAQRTTGAIILYESIVKGKPVLNTLRDSMKNHRHDPRDNPKLLSYLLDHIEEIRDLYREKLKESDASAHEDKHESGGDP